MPPREDGSRMHRFQSNAARFTARDAVITVLLAAGLFALLQTGPLEPSVSKITRPLSPDEELSARGGFSGRAAAGSADEVPPVTASAFEPGQLGAAAPAKRRLERLLVTGDSLSTPLDVTLARRLTASGVEVERDPHLGGAISNTELIDFGRLAVTQTARHRPDAVVVFIGANEGFPMEDAGGEEVECCGADWAAIYANRVRQMIHAYRRGGAGRVYWITVPTPRDPDRQEIGRVVNAAIAVAAQPWRADVRVIDAVARFAPGGRYQGAIDVGGREVLVRESDGIHLNRRGSELLADDVTTALTGDFTGVPAP